MTDPRDVPRGNDRLLEALIRLARAVIATDPKPGPRRADEAAKGGVSGGEDVGVITKLRGSRPSKRQPAAGAKGASGHPPGTASAIAREPFDG